MSQKSKNPQQMYEQNIHRIEEILKHDNDFRKNYGGQSGQRIKEAYSIMRKQMQAALLTKSKEQAAKLANSEEKSCVKKAFDVLIDIVLQSPITDMVRDLSMEMSKLGINWNLQVGKRPDLGRDIKLLQSVVLGQKTLDDTIVVSQKMIHRLQREMSRRPVAYELSKAYFESVPLSKSSQKDQVYKTPEVT